MFHPGRYESQVIDGFNQPNGFFKNNPAFDGKVFFNPHADQHLFDGM
jgi:hypothetical protein